MNKAAIGRCLAYNYTAIDVGTDRAMLMAPSRRSAMSTRFKPAMTVYRMKIYGPRDRAIDFYNSGKETVVAARTSVCRIRFGKAGRPVDVIAFASALQYGLRELAALSVVLIAD